MPQNKKILLFDDDYASMSPLKQYLERAIGFQVALTAHKQLPKRLAQERFDLVCVDLMIHPTSIGANGDEIENIHFEGVNWQKTGLEFLKRLRQGEFHQEDGVSTSPDVPVIVLSAVANYSVEDELDQDIFVNAYIEKPFALEEITKLIRKCLQEYDSP